MKTKFTILLMAFLCLWATESQAVYRVASITPAGSTCAGSIQLEVSGSTGPYTITWTGPNGFQAPSPSAGITSISNLCGGNYTAEVTNSYGCIKILGPIQIIQSVDPTNGGPVKGEVLDVCDSFLSADDVFTTGGTLGDILLGGSFSGSGFSTSNNLTFDSNRTKESNDELGSISLTVDPLVCSTRSKTRTGKIITDTNCQITYLWSNGATTPQINQLTPGTYCVEVYLQKDRTSEKNLIDVQCFTIGLSARCSKNRSSDGHGKTTLTTNQPLQIQAFPNPFQEQLQLEINAPHTQEATIKLQDITGRTILLYPISITEGMNNYTIPNTSQLVAGIYTLILDIEGVEQQVSKLVKSK